MFLKSLKSATLNLVNHFTTSSNNFITINQDLKCCGIGGSIVDYLINITDTFLDRYSLTKGQMHMVSKDTFDEIINANNLICKDFCGSVANTIRFLNSCGIESFLISNVGNDKEGADYKNQAKNNFAISCVPDIFTSRSAILITEDGQRTMCTATDDQNYIDFDNLTNDTLTNFTSCSVFVVEGYLFFNSKNIEAIKTMCHLAKQNGAKVAISLSDSYCVKSFFDILSKVIFDYCDYVFANKDEFEEFLKHLDMNTIVRSPIFVVTNGSDGCKVLRLNEEYEDFLTTPIANPADSTGAGDIFMGGFIYGILNNLSIKDSASIANKNAGIVISQNGTLIDSPILTVN